MPESYIFYVANAFATAAFGGNPAGVFPDATGLTDGQMQAIAKQLNLIETVFVLPTNVSGEAGFQLRYFTPEKEIPLAGHPTIAAWSVLAASGRISNPGQREYRQQTNLGIQDITLKKSQGGTHVFMSQPQPVFRREICDKQRVAKVFSIDEAELLPELPIASIDTGLGHIVFGVKDRAVLMKVRRNILLLRDLCHEYGASEAQIYCRQTFDPSLSLHTRNICPRDGIEDPACGVGTSALLAYLMRYDCREALTTEIYAEQGHSVNRPSVVHVSGTRRPDGCLALVLGGSAVIMLRGEFFLTGLMC